MIQRLKYHPKRGIFRRSELLIIFTMESSLPKPKKKAFYKRWWIWLLLVIVVGGIGIGFAANKAYQESQRLALGNLEETVQVEKRVLNKTIATNGTIQADQTIQLFATRPGKVIDVNFSIGDNVNKDDVLIKTDGGNLSDEEIKAPFDGRVLAVHTFVDNAASMTSPLIEVAFRSNHIEFIASESEVLNLRVGQHVNITVPSYENGKTEYDGKITFVDVQKQTVAANGAGATGAVAESGYIVKVDANDLPEDLRNVIGLSVDLVVDVYETEPVLSLEPSAIQYDDEEQAFVYLPPELTEEFIAKALQAENVTDVLETRDITIGFEGDQYFEITDGVKDGDSILMYIPSTTASSIF